MDISHLSRLISSQWPQNVYATLRVNNSGVLSKRHNCLLTFGRHLISDRWHQLFLDLRWRQRQILVSCRKHLHCIALNCELYWTTLSLTTFLIAMNSWHQIVSFKLIWLFLKELLQNSAIITCLLKDWLTRVPLRGQNKQIDMWIEMRFIWLKYL